MTAPAWVSLLVGAAAFIGVVASLNQRTEADRRAEWWRRATWAVDHTLSENLDAQLVGFDVLRKLQESNLITRSDRSIFSSWATERLFPGDDTDDSSGDTGIDEEDS